MSVNWIGDFLRHLCVSNSCLEHDVYIEIRERHCFGVLGVSAPCMPTHTAHYEASQCRSEGLRCLRWVAKQCLLLSNNGQIVAVPRMSAKCQKQARHPRFEMSIDAPLMRPAVASLQIKKK